ncbi:hypothetical protein CSO01_19030 [Cellulomonas soli]|uniref:Pyrrolo-quinoline quinone repeat domain-containing protein n=2 Tax=Cellulomonas soli TaxID=931535 RepID=A0A512PDC1_9CELL|nr:hypothetical protein CSO01_19030 [Cellulomonas soli]
MQRVELDESQAATSVLPLGDGPAGYDPGARRPPAGRGPAGASERASRPGRTTLLVVIGSVVVAGLVLSAVLAVLHAREARRAEVIAAVPGLVRPLDTPPHELWRAPVASAADEAVLVSGDTLVAVDDTDGVWRLSGFDVTDGGRRWSLGLADVVTAPRTTGVASTAGVTVRCPSDGGDVGPLVVCTLTGPDPQVWFGRGQVVALDGLDGHEVGRWPVPGRLLGAARLADDVVVVRADDRGAVQVARHDARTGAVRWTRPTGDTLPAWSTSVSVQVRATTSFVLVTGSAAAALAAGDGTELVPTAQFSSIRLVAVRDHLGSWTTAEGGWWRDASGARLFALPALPAPAVTDDGSADDVIVVDTGAALQGVDARSGQERWTLEQRLDAVALVSGRLVVAGEDGYGVLNPVDGRVLWTTQVEGPLPWRPVSDGALVLAPGVAPGGGPGLVGLGLQDGVRYWSVPLPEGVVGVSGVAGHLLVRTAHEVLVLG